MVRGLCKSILIPIIVEANKKWERTTGEKKQKVRHGMEPKVAFPKDGAVVTRDLPNHRGALIAPLWDQN